MRRTMIRTAMNAAIALLAAASLPLGAAAALADPAKGADAAIWYQIRNDGRSSRRSPRSPPWRPRSRWR